MAWLRADTNVLRGCVIGLVAFASPLHAAEPLPSPSALFDLCVDHDIALVARIDALRPYGFEAAADLGDQWDAANAAQVALFLNGRTLPYSESGAKNSFKGLYPRNAPFPEIEGQRQAYLNTKDASAAVKLFETDNGLIGCSFSLSAQFGDYDMDIPVDRAWQTPAGVIRRHSPKSSDQRFETIVFTDTWADWFDLPAPPHIWIDITSQLAGPTG